MNKHIPKVIELVVNNDLCIGCGLCVYKCPEDALEIESNEFGFLIPKLAGKCNLEQECIKVCPFNPFPDEAVKTENEISDIFLTENSHFQGQIGKYIGLYTGYSNEFRMSSSSGGIATYILTELLKQGIVQHVISVKEAKTSNKYYEYAISSSVQELVNSSKTKYYPVTLGKVLSEINQLEGTFAIIGVGCFIKALRLAQFQDPSLRKKITFLVGIICGGVKSSFYTDYLAGKTNTTTFIKPQFRVKDINSTANDYSFSCIDEETNIERSIKMSSIGDMWGTGLFKAKACDFCDDVLTELADISLGDAWLEPYSKDGKGTSIIITRSLLAASLISQGLNNGALNLNQVNENDIVKSQQGSFNHRHKGLYFRIAREIKRGNSTPPKRSKPQKLNLFFRLVLIIRSLVRSKSLIVWKNTTNANIFDKKMRKSLKTLKVTTYLYHYITTLDRKINKAISSWK